jgi:hypothetical protein
MSATPIEQPSADAGPAPAPPPAVARRFAMDPEDRPVPVLSSEPPRGPLRPGIVRALVVAKRVCMIIAVAIFGVVVLAFMVDTHDEPRGTPTQGVSMRG